MKAADTSLVIAAFASWHEQQLPEHGIAGGAAYDALIAATAASHGARLITCDKRAAAVYEAYGLGVMYIG